MAQPPLPTDLVLVCIIPHPRDLEIARTLGWYRIPLISGPQIIAADFLAFYQPASFGPEQKWRIEYVARLNGYEMLLRRDLFKDELDHPHAMNEYFKMEIGGLQRLPKPILAGEWKRITFFYTTGELLTKAATIADLQVPSGERTVLYRAIRDKAITEQGYDTRQTPDLPIDLDLLALFVIRESPQMFFGNGAAERDAAD